MNLINVRRFLGVNEGKKEKGGEREVEWESGERGRERRGRGEDEEEESGERGGGQ